MNNMMLIKFNSPRLSKFKWITEKNNNKIFNKLIHIKNT